ncbi:hypothetical protein H0H93_012095, partial [Arthromyces matolae]
MIHPLVHDVFMTWGPLKDAKSHKPLFDKKAWKKAKEILELIRKGLVSDPPGIPLYYIIGLDRKAGGLPIYRDFRGTNFVEGGVHRHLRTMLPSCNTSVRHMVTCLLDFILRHNLLVGTYNSTGKKYAGHDSIWLINEIQELEITLSTIYPVPPVQLSWVNGNLYQKTTETMGIAVIPESVRVQSGMQEYDEVTDGKQPQAYLAKMQGTRRPILPIHTMKERKLFNKLMREREEFQSCTTSIKIGCVKIWNRYAETDDNIYYKLEEHLTAHFNGKWQESANITESRSQALTVTEPLQKQLQNPARAEHNVNIPAFEISENRATHGFRPIPDPHTNIQASTVQAFANANSLEIPAAESTIALSTLHAFDSRPETVTQSKKKDRKCPR